MKTIILFLTISFPLNAFLQQTDSDGVKIVNAIIAYPTINSYFVNFDLTPITFMGDSLQRAFYKHPKIDAYFFLNDELPEDHFPQPLDFCLLSIKNMKIINNNAKVEIRIIDCVNRKMVNYTIFLRKEIEWIITECEDSPITSE